jgi:putative addiction module component (TIGR02574 family)
MSTVDALLDQALRLSYDDRVDLVHRLLLSLDESVPLTNDEWIAAWKPELERRLEAYRRGETIATDWRESLERVRRSLAERART